MGRFAHRQGFQAQITPQTVIGVNHQITRRQRARFCNNISGFLAATRPRQTVAQDILFGDDREIRRLEAMFQRQHDPGDRLAAHLVHGAPVIGGHDGF